MIFFLCIVFSINDWGWVRRNAGAVLPPVFGSISKKKKISKDGGDVGGDG